MADSQVPWGIEALTGAVRVRAWKKKPSWYLVASEDRMIPPEAQRAMARRAGSTVVEVRGSHARVRVAAGGGCRADRNRVSGSRGYGKVRSGT